MQQFRLSGRLHTLYGDLRSDISGVSEGVDAVFHFAAKTFVDHSILHPTLFVETNVMGTLNLLEDVVRFRVPRFVQISTDEVYGEILEGAYSENAPVNPRNPYAASKLAADALVLSYGVAYKIHVTVARTENNYGPYQHPQKVFPKFTRRAIMGERLPVYGDGSHSRQWLWVDDHSAALLLLLNSSYESGQVFHIAGNQEVRNLELAKRILQYLGKSQDQVEFISTDTIRPGHDRRYALSCEKILRMGWEPTVDVEEGLARAVSWYQQNLWWFL